jgi:predicted short-subunit dehydrogenase-like oxidoreductase (DUF2520 family)
VKSTRRSFNIGIIGAGAVGTTFASMLHRSGNNIVAVVSRSEQSARKCGKVVSCRNCSDDLSVIPSTCNFILIAVPDQSIKTVAESLAALSNLRFSRISVCHTSGSLTTDALEPVARKGARVFSMHPIQTFPGEKSLKDQIRSMNGITYGVEGPQSSHAIAKSLVRQMGGEILFVPIEAKILYHLACVIASNYSVALVGAIDSIAGKITQKKLQPFEKLMQTSLENAMRLGAGKALTGPVVRGDSEVIAEHLRSIQDPELRTLYKSLGACVLKLAVQEGRLRPEQIAKLRELLTGKD